MKKIIAVALLILVLFALLNIRQFIGIPVIGKITGAENEQIIIDGTTYERDYNSGFSSDNKDKYLGVVRNTKIKMRVYSIDGKENADYIYALWGWEGAIYKRAE